MRGGVVGLIEGFYGRPWTWDERVEVMAFCAARGLTHYVYAPKDDPLHRERWREPYHADALAGFERLTSEGSLEVGFGISPGLSIDYGAPDDRAALAAKVEQVLGVGIGLICLALDDIPNRPGLGAEHAGLTAWLHDRLAGRAELLLVPTEYVGTGRTPYLDALAAGVPDGVAIGWTGASVMNDAVTATEARARSEALGGRPPLLWDNYPVNDGMMADRLYTGPLRGRDPGLVDTCGGYLANPMVQPRASLLPLASTAAWLRGADPLAAWGAQADDAGLRVFAEACDGDHPRRLVAALAAAAHSPRWAAPAADLARWLEAAEVAPAPGLEAEVGPWLDQVHTEAAAGLVALRLLQATKPVVRVDPTGRGRVAPPSNGRMLNGSFDLGARWAALRRAEVAVMGLRYGIRPMVAQRPDGAWAPARGLYEEGGNAIDHLARLALDTAAASAGPAGLVVTADGTAVDLGADGVFTCTPGAVVEARSGDAVTMVATPCDPPLDDGRLR